MQLFLNSLGRWTLFLAMLPVAALAGTTNGTASGSAIPKVPFTTSGTITSDIVLTGSEKVASGNAVTVTLLGLQHDFSGDLRITLSYVDSSGTTTQSVDLINRVGATTIFPFGSAADFGDGQGGGDNYLFNSDFAGDIWAVTACADPPACTTAYGDADAIPGVSTDTVNLGRYFTSTTSGAKTNLSYAFSGLNVAGTWRLTITDAADPNGGSFVGWTISVVTVAGTQPPQTITAVAGSGQSATVGTSFGGALQAKVTDASSTPLSGITVTFTAPSSGASATFGGSTTATAVTNASGIATSPIPVANSISGAYAVTASFPSITAASFSLNNTVSTGGGSAQSIVFPGTTYSSATLPTIPAFNALGSWRMETRLHNFLKTGTTYSQYVWLANGYALLIAPNGAFLQFSNRNNFYCSLDLAGATDITVRLQRDGATGIYSLQAWNNQNSQRLPAYTPNSCGSDSAASTVSISGEMFVGGVYAQDYFGAMAYLRVYNTSTGSTTAPADAPPGGELLRYEFETTPFGQETSGNTPAYPLSIYGSVSTVATPSGATPPPPSGQSVVFPGTSYSSATLPTTPAFNALGSWRMETRLHNFLKTGTTYSQYIWLANGYALLIAPNGAFLQFSNRNNFYCSLDLAGATDIIIRLQRDGATGIYSLLAWNNQSSQRLPAYTPNSCGSDAAGGTVSISGEMFVGGVYAQDYFGAMAFLRVYNTSTSSTTAPANTAPGGELLRYEFETTPLGQETSGNSPAYPLTLFGSVSTATTPGGGTSVLPTVAITAPVDGAVGLKGAVPLSATATAAAGKTMATVQFVDGVNVIATVSGTGPTYAATWNTTNVPDGSHTLRAVATDTQGNSATSAAVSVTLSNAVAAAQSIVFPGTTYSSATLPTTPAFNAMGSWRMETRLHNFLKTGTTYSQYVWLANGYALLIAPNGAFLQFSNRNNFYCSLDLAGATDITVRLQRDGATGIYSLQAWNNQNSQRLPAYTPNSCGTDAAGGTVSISGEMFVGGVYAQDYFGAMAYLRVYNTSTSSTTAPVDAPPGGELLRYEFETTPLGQETSGNSPAYPLTIYGSVSTVATPSGATPPPPSGQSVVFPGTSYSSATLPTTPAFNALGSWRMETRLHNFLKTGTTYSQYVWLANGYALLIAPNGAFLQFSNRNNFYCSLDLAGATDITVRLQRDGATGIYSLQAWNNQNSQRLPAYTPNSCGSDAASGTVSISGEMFVGGVYAQDYFGAMAFLRMYNTSTSSTTAPANTAPGGELLRYEFETTPLGQETSGNSPAYPLTLFGSVSTATTP